MKKTSEILSDIISNNFCETDDEFIESQFFNCGKCITWEHFDIVNEAQAKYYNKDIGQYEILSIYSINIY